MRPPAPRVPAAPTTPGPGPAPTPSPVPTAEEGGSDLLLSPAEAAEFALESSASAPQASDAVSGLEERRKERRRAYRRVLWFRVSVALGVVAVVAALVWAVVASPLLALRADAVTVEGETPYLETEAIADYGRAHEGTPLIRVDTDGIAAQVAALPAIEQAQVHREWPWGLRIEIVPRMPVAIAGSPQAEVVDLVGADGVVVAQVGPDAVPEGVPWLAIDMAGEDASAAVQTVLAVLGELSSDLTGQIAQVSATSGRDITFTLTSGAEVFWGSGQETELKESVLLTLLQVGASYYDVSTPRAPITR